MGRGLRALALISGVGLAASVALATPMRVDGHNRTSR